MRGNNNAKWRLIKRIKTINKLQECSPCVFTRQDYIRTSIPRPYCGKGMECSKPGSMIVYDRAHSMREDFRSAARLEGRPSVTRLCGARGKSEGCCSTPLVFLLAWSYEWRFDLLSCKAIMQTEKRRWRLSVFLSSSMEESWTVGIVVDFDR